jgi:hypothetical protein
VSTKVMRAKIKVTFVHEYGVPKSSETLRFSAVAASKYPEDGSDENNTYAKFSPAADFSIQVANPVLFGKFSVGEEYYVDFIKAD